MDQSLQSGAKENYGDFRNIRAAITPLQNELMIMRFALAGKDDP
jgi:hypothetical protein